MPSAFAPFNFGMARRVLRDVRLAPVLKLTKDYLIQYYSIKRQLKTGTPHPTTMHLEAATFCGEDCKGCYVPKKEREDRGTMSLETGREAIREGRAQKIRIYNFIGGETLARETLPLIETIVRENRDLSFYICTNGRFIAEESGQVDRLVMNNNLSIGLSLDGFEKTNDSIRGEGCFKRVMLAAKYLKSKRCFFGILPTLRKENAGEILSGEFLGLAISVGAAWAVYGLPKDSLRDQFYGFYTTASEKPIFVEFDVVGNVYSKSKSYARTVYVSKDGTIMDDRKKRNPISSVGEGLAPYQENPGWVKKYA